MPQAMKGIVMSKKSLIPDTFERLNEIAARCDRAEVRRGQVKTKHLALCPIEQLVAELIKRKELKEEFLHVLVEAITSFDTLYDQLWDEVADLSVAGADFAA
jgi:hypothetical protein